MEKESEFLTFSFCLRQRAQANVGRDEAKDSIPFISDLTQSAPTEDSEQDFNQPQEWPSTASLANR